MNSNKINVEVEFPALSKKMDFSISATLTVGGVSLLIGEIIEQVEKISLLKENLILCNMDTKMVLEDNMSLNDAKIFNGTNLILL